MGFSVRRLFKEWRPHNIRILLNWGTWGNFQRLVCTLHFLLSLSCQHQNNQSGSNKREGREEAAELAASPASFQFTLMTILASSRAPVRAGRNTCQWGGLRVGVRSGSLISVKLLAWGLHPERHIVQEKHPYPAVKNTLARHSGDPLCVLGSRRRHVNWLWLRIWKLLMEGGGPALAQANLRDKALGMNFASRGKTTLATS